MGEAAHGDWTVLRARDRVAQPWKNGGGVTREIAVHPPGAGMDAFEWRVSTAVVASDGPFSCFEGVDRILLLLEGDSLDLAVDGRPPVRLTLDSAPQAFAGDAPAEAWIPHGPITDLNVMVRRGAWTATAERRTGAGQASGEGDVRLVLALDRLAFEGAALEPGDALLIQGGAAVRLEPAGPPGRWVLVRLSRA